MTRFSDSLFMFAAYSSSGGVHPADFRTPGGRVTQWLSGTPPKECPGYQSAKLRDWVALLIPISGNFAGLAQ